MAQCVPHANRIASRIQVCFDTPMVAMLEPILEPTDLLPDIATGEYDVFVDDAPSPLVFELPCGCADRFSFTR